MRQKKNPAASETAGLSQHDTLGGDLPNTKTIKGDRQVERRVGEMLAESEKAKPPGRPGKEIGSRARPISAPTLKELGISKTQSKHALNSGVRNQAPEISQGDERASKDNLSRGDLEDRHA